MAEEKKVIKTCQREVGETHGAVVTCDRVILIPNGLNWCDECLSRLPIWPDDRVGP